MKILVCISNVPDTTTKVRLTAGGTQIDTGSVQWIMNPWDELALTRALEIKEQGAIEAVNLVTVGRKEAEPTLRKGLALGADKAFRVDAEPADSYFTALQIASLLRNEPHEIVLCGIESSDYDGSNVGGMLAELLDLPSVSSVSAIDAADGAALVKREIDGGYQLLSVPVPFLAVVQKGIALEPRVPSMRGVMSARSKPLVVLAPAPGAPAVEFAAFELMKPRAACKRIDPEKPEELLRLLHEEAKVI